MYDIVRQYVFKDINYLELVVLIAFTILVIIFNPHFPNGSSLVVMAAYAVLRLNISHIHIYHILFISTALFMAAATPYNFSPDEYTHLWAIDYYNSATFLPPKIASAEVEPYVVKHYNLSYLYLKDFTYKIYGKIGYLLGFGSGDQWYLAYRYINILILLWVSLFLMNKKYYLFAFMAPFFQFTYIFTYVNGEVYSILISSLVLYYTQKINFEDSSKINMNNIFILSALLGLLFFARVHFYLIGLYSLVFFAKLLLSNKNYTTILLAIIPGALILILGLIPDMIVYGFSDICIHGVGKCSDIYEALNNSDRIAPMDTGLTLWGMLSANNFGWLKSTFISVVGNYGYMAMPLHKYIVIMSLLVFIIILSFSGYKAAIASLFFILVSIFISIYYSYTYDYQPQGRYIFPGLMIAAGILQSKINYDGWLASILNINYIFLLLSTMAFIAPHI